MPVISLVVAMARNRVIGASGRLPWHLPDDLKRFKKLTLGGSIVMGRRTHDSIGRPLPGRRNIVVTRRAGASFAGCEVAHSLDEALALAGDAPEVFVIGGAELYRLALPRADRLYLTLVDAEYPGDTVFPELDPADWRETARERGAGFTFVTCERAPGRPSRWGRRAGPGGT